MGKGKQSARKSPVDRSSRAVGEKDKRNAGEEGCEGGEVRGKEKPTSAAVYGDNQRPATEDAPIDIDEQLEAAALRRNLSVTNVKSILHHLVKDQRVLKLVQRLAAREEEREAGSTQQNSDDWDELTAYEPRLTRSRVRQAVMSAVATGSLSADKIALLKTSTSTKTSSTVPSSSSAIDDVESSDEEYNPDISSGDEEEEEEEEETEEDEEEEMEVDNEAEDKVEGESWGEEEGGGELGGATGSTDLNSQLIGQTSSQQRHVPAPLTETPTTSDLSSSAVPTLSSATTTSTSSVLTSPVPPPIQTQGLPNSTETAPTSSLATPTCDATLPTSPSRSVQQDREVQEEAASFLASLSETQTLSPLKFISQHPVPSDISINHVSGVSTATSNSTDPGNTNAPDISGITCSRVDPSNPLFSVSSGGDIGEGEPGTEEEIAQRTRSKHPLHDVSITSLEAGLGPVEGEDPPVPRELDPDELWWHQWLNSLTSDTPLNDSQLSHVTEEDEEDGEYNFLADCLREEEREEFRNDRAVRIPRKEVDDLITELFNPSVEGSSGLLLSSDGLDLTGAYLLETLGVQIPALTQATAQTATTSASLAVGGDSDSPTTTTPSSPPPGCHLSDEQTVQLWTQIQQHFQLLMQTFVLARFEPSLVFVSQVAAQALDEVSRWCLSSRHSGGGSLWHIPDLQDGLDLVKALDPYDDSAVKLTPSAGSPPKVPDGAQRVLMDTTLFWNYPHFLPASGFTPLTTSSASSTKYFTPEEECLLVLGMEHYGSSAWEEIQQNILPTKTLKQLKLRVKNRCSKRSGSNVIKEYKKTKKIPQIEEDVPIDLPQWILVQYKKLANKEKEEVQKKQKQIEEVKKILTTTSRGTAKATPTADLPLAPRGEASSSTLHSETVDSPTDPAISVQSVVSTASGSASLPPGSKRNLNDNMSCAQAVTKKPRVTGGGKARQGRGGRVSRTVSQDTSISVVDAGSRSRGRTSIEHLLVAVGVAGSDPTARFSYSFLREVKATVSESHPSVYQQFVGLLQEHSRCGWRPSELYKKVSHLFQPWPHIISLFTEFLDPQDCLEANSLQEKYEVQNVKSFIEKLQSKYSNAPLHLNEITDRLKRLDTPTVTRQQVCDSLLPLMEVHEELAVELRRFVYHLAPAPRADDVYEEVTIADANGDPDEYEQVTLLGLQSGASTSHVVGGRTVHIAGRNIQTTNLY